MAFIAVPGEAAVGAAMTASLGAAGDLFVGWNSASVSGKSGFMFHFKAVSGVTRALIAELSSPLTALCGAVFPPQPNVGAAHTSVPTVSFLCIKF